MKAKVFKHEVRDAGIIDCTPEHLINQEVELLAYEDEGYDTPRPTGHERCYFHIRRADGVEERVDAAFVCKTDNTRLWWDDIKNLPRNFVG
jgi:hypothetical protein